MRGRVLRTMVSMVVVLVTLLGVPLLIGVWWIPGNEARRDLSDRLERVATDLIKQEGEDGRITGTLDLESFRLILPEGGRLEVVYPTAVGYKRAVIGDDIVDPLTERRSLGDAGALTLSVPQDGVRERRWTSVATGVGGLALAIALGTAVAAITAGRIVDPLAALAERAGRLARGDFTVDEQRHGIVELDGVAGALDRAAVEISMRLQREGRIVGEVSHQLRSRLTAIRLRLDELALHPDPEARVEAEAALTQVDRLSRELDELIAASRRADERAAADVDAGVLVGEVVAHFEPSYLARRRRIVLDVEPGSRAFVDPARLREAVSALVDNALVHGAGDCRIGVDAVGGQTMRIVVSDSGDGVGDEIATEIFRRGFSGKGSSGVGLSLARALVEADGGRLDLLERIPATFAIFVPTRPEAVRERVDEPR